MHDRPLGSLQRLNPTIPASTLVQVAFQVAKPESPSLIKNNKTFHSCLLEGVKVSFNNGTGEEKTDYVKLVDFANTANNQFLVVNQYTITGSKGNRRPDVIVFVNGLPLAVLELKNLSEEVDGL